MKMLIPFVSLVMLSASSGAQAQELHTQSNSPSGMGATTQPFAPWGQREGLYSPYGPMQNSPGSVPANPLYSSPAGHPGGPQAPVGETSLNESGRPLVDTNRPETGREPSTIHPASRVPGAPADGGTTSGATTGSSSLTEPDAVSPDGRKKAADPRKK